MDDRDRLDLVRLVLGEPRLDRVRVHAGAPVARDELDVAGRDGVAILLHRVANQPVSNISTLSPGDSVLTSAASQAPVPEAG